MPLRSTDVAVTFRCDDQEAVTALQEVLELVEGGSVEGVSIVKKHKATFVVTTLEEKINGSSV